MREREWERERQTYTKKEKEDLRSYSSFLERWEIHCDESDIYAVFPLKNLANSYIILHRRSDFQILTFQKVRWKVLAKHLLVDLQAWEDRGWISGLPSQLGLTMSKHREKESIEKS